MKFQQRFYTEAKNLSQPTNLPSAKFDSNSTYDQELLKAESRPIPKNLTIKVHEAHLNVDVSILGKMTTYTKIQIGSTTWKTSVDKESHMNPKWNESKTFEIKSLCKYIKSFPKIAGNVVIKEFLPQKPRNNDESTTTPEGEPRVVIGVYDQAFLHDMLIGEVTLFFQDILKSKPIADWYLYNKNEEVGSIRLSMKFEYGDENPATNYGPEPISSTLKYTSSESRFSTEAHRINTESSDTGNGKSPEFYRKNIFVHKNIPSNFSGQEFYDASTAPSFQRFSGFQSSDFGQHVHHQSAKSNPRAESSGREPFRLNKRPSGVASHKTKSEEKEYETLVTYENCNEDEEDTPGERQTYENFFTRSSDDRKSDSSDEEPSECELESDEGDEGERASIAEDYSYDTSTEPNNEIQRHLKAIKKANNEIRTRESEMKIKFEEMKLASEKLQKEKEILESNKNELNTREECLKNEKKNLALNARAQEEELQEFCQKLGQYKVALAESQKEEKVEKQLTLQLEAQIKQLALNYQRETQALKNLEYQMYRKLIAQKRQDLCMESEESPKATFIEQGEKGGERENRFMEAQNGGLGEMLKSVGEQRVAMEKELEARVKNVERLKEILRIRNEEDKS